ncbi:serine hydrolase [Candidatus Aminicenantes bacterium AC-335-A11]|jgi:CubicO group peptidase (beta-lactamase class C family)|nr:serine hydrolase [SCandidatus Aminicenantes bacterium Aminicenantia_JdfR_composite]MCP2598341.1 serine hydrolase [Candidatus Aminicenantes bacterium AC-335-L06]MCP2606063.1 serine hydrolase [Candidatus Aminicenantes bacterium AC-708-I09]MCP2618382.1 serine hydrolase [Candidatus Aminicenantes bacterium AC-335-A11]
MRKDIFRRIFIIFCIFVFVLVLQAKDSDIEKNLKGFDKFVLKTMKEWNVPGLAISIVKDEKVVLAKGYGFRDIKKKLEVTPKTLFAIGSCTKAFTAVALGILVDEGKLDWDKPVREYLPFFKLKDQFASERITPRDLLCHRSGLPRHDLVWYNSSYSREELIRRLRYLEPSQDFRYKWQYQNLMFVVAGYLVEKITGKTWEEFVRERIFKPLGMKNSNFSVEDSKKSPDFALPYYKKNGKIIEIPFRNIDNVGPAGSINSNVEEMAKWVILNLNKGKLNEKQIISETNINQIHSPQMVISQPIRYDELFYSSYGMGWVITAYRGHLLLQHGGGIDGFTALVSFMPKDKIGMVILTNLSGTPLPTIIAYNVYDRLLGLDEVPWNERIKKEVQKAKAQAEKARKEKDKDRKLNTKPSHPLEDYTGEYENPGYGIIKIEKEGDHLKATYNSITYTLTHYHYDVFELKNELLEITKKVAFFMDKKGNINSLSIQMEPAVKDIIFTRIPEKKMKEESFLKQFTGKYELDGLIMTIYLKGKNKLILVVPGQPEYELVPYKGTEFNLKNFEGYSVEFKKDKSGKVISMIIKQPNGTFIARKKIQGE